MGRAYPETVFSSILCIYFLSFPLSYFVWRGRQAGRIKIKDHVYTLDIEGKDKEICIIHYPVSIIT